MFTLARTKQKLEYVFYNPNDPEVLIKELITIAAEIAVKKVDQQLLQMAEAAKSQEGTPTTPECITSGELPPNELPNIDTQTEASQPKPRKKKSKSYER